ncbi:unnamed protein product [Euphydryas editha]|uniref:Endonuclease-reverse transcriptase n=1 Tax=Euphydryas editha TaxID=104508 RepID=A0AAU9VFI4_EUPED|nr:unnamed protein product [Euphydryas editha]
MEDITKILKSIQLELAEQKKDMKEIEINITNNINKNINEHFKIIEHKYDRLNEQIQNQEKILDRMERHNRKKNLVFFGIEEGEKSYQELENKILKFLNEVNIPCERNEIEAVKRLGRNKEKMRPITVTFTTIGKKIILLQNQKNNKNSSVYYKEDYPYKILEKRKQLKIELQKYKAEGKKAIIKYDKLIVLNDYNTNKNQKNQKQSKKRNLQFSPNQSETSHEKQALKKNKITSFVRQRKD